MEVFWFVGRAPNVARVVRGHAEPKALTWNVARVVSETSNLLQTSNLPLPEPVVWGWWEVGFRGLEVGGLC